MSIHEYLTEGGARSLYVDGDAAHDFDHILRVTRLAERIARDEGADVTLVRLAALLHDVPVAETESGCAATGRSSHHLDAARYASAILAQRGLGTEGIETVVHAIEAHRFRDQSIRPLTPEAKCLYDADKLDSMGAIGVARCFAYAGAWNNRLWTQPWTTIAADQEKPTGADYSPVHEYVYKLSHLYDTLCTATGKRIGAERHAMMVAFFDCLDAEVTGQA